MPPLVERMVKAMAQVTIGLRMAPWLAVYLRMLRCGLDIARALRIPLTPTMDAALTQHVVAVTLRGIKPEVKWL
jgi:hypothetical protein